MQKLTITQRIRSHGGIRCAEISPRVRMSDVRINREIHLPQLTYGGGEKCRFEIARFKRANNIALAKITESRGYVKPVVRVRTRYGKQYGRSTTCYHSS